MFSSYDFAFHHLVLQIGNDAFGAYMRAASACASQDTKGALPKSLMRQIARPKIWKNLEESGFIFRNEDEFFISDFEKLNELFFEKSEKEIQESNAQSKAPMSASERQRLFRERKKFEKNNVLRNEEDNRSSEERNENVTQALHGVTKERNERVTESNETNKDSLSLSKDININKVIEKEEREENVTERNVTRNALHRNEEERTKEPAKRGTRLAQDWSPSSATLKTLSEENCIDPLRCLPPFVDYWRSVPGAKGRMSPSLSERNG